MPDSDVLREILNPAKNSLGCVVIKRLDTEEKTFGICVNEFDFGKLIGFFTSKNGNVCGKCGSKIDLDVEFIERYYPKGLSCYTFVSSRQEIVLKTLACAKCLNSALGEEKITELRVFVDKYVLPIIPCLM